MYTWLCVYCQLRDIARCKKWRKSVLLVLLLLTSPTPSHISRCSVGSMEVVRVVFFHLSFFSVGVGCLYTSHLSVSLSVFFACPSIPFLPFFLSLSLSLFSRHQPPTHPSLLFLILHFSIFLHPLTSLSSPLSLHPHSSPLPFTSTSLLLLLTQPFFIFSPPPHFSPSPSIFLFSFLSFFRLTSKGN